MIATAAPSIAVSQSSPQVEASVQPNSDASDLDEGLPRVSFKEALAQDAAHLAKMNGISQERAEAALIVGDGLTSVTGKIRALIGDREVSITKEYVPVTRLRVEISGFDEIPGLDGIVSASDSPVEILYTEKLSVQHVIKALDSATDGWKSAFPQITRTTVDDSDPGHVIVFISPGTRLAEADLRKVTPEFPLNVRLTTEIDADGPDFAHNLSRGNLRMNIQGSGDSECTSGFMATKNTTGTKVLTTAAHCANNLAYKSWSTGAVTNTDFGLQNYNAQNDSQYHYTDGKGSALFWVNGGYRDVYGVTLRTHLARGDLICAEGRNSTYDCGTVASITSTIGGSDVLCNGPCDNVYIATTGLTLNPGDSGGSVFVGNQALGLTKSKYSSGGVNYGVVNSISYVRARLDVTIRASEDGACGLYCLKCLGVMFRDTAP